VVGTEGTSALEKLLNDGWNDHATDGERLGRELEAAARMGVPPSLLAPFLHLATHTLGGHLGDWPRALALGKRVLAGKKPAAETAKAWGRLYVAAFLVGDSLEAADLELSYLGAAGDDFGAALLDMRFMLVDALVHSGRSREGARLYRSALDLVAQIERSEHLNRSVAIASNNLGWELYEKPSRTADEDALMQLSADMSLEFWLECGSWINEERGLYLKALVAHVTGNPERGLTLADAALTVIKANGVRPLDAARLHLARAASLSALGDRDGGQRAMADANAAAAKLAKELKDQFDVERAETAAALVERI
jgi:hypothetical protein